MQEEKEKGDSCTSVSFKALILLAKRDKKSIMANRRETLKLLKRKSIGMIHVNVRGLLVREIENEKQLIIQLRKREGEPEVYELPGGRINEYEKIVDGLKREIIEETGLSVKSIRGEKSAIVAAGDSFTMECIKPFSAYQTLEGPVDSFGIHFICEVEGELLTTGDDTADIHWASKKDVQQLIDEHKFSEIDLPAVLMFLRDEN